MKRQTFMKSTLCLLMALVCNVAWAEVTLPTVSTGAEMHFYRIKSARSGKYAAYTGDNTQLAQTTETTSSTIWYVTATASNKYRLHNLSTDKKYASVFSFTADGSIVYIKENPHNAGYVCVSTTENLSSNCWDDQGNETKIGNYNPRSGDAVGTSWTFEEVTVNEGLIAESYSITLTETTLNDTYTGNFTCYRYGDVKLLPLGVSEMGASLTNVVWDENTLTADIKFPLPVSKEGNARPVVISGFKGSLEAGSSKYYVDGTNVKARPSGTVAKGYDEWEIYPTFANGVFTFVIKNVGADKYIKSNATTAVETEGTITVVDKAEATSFALEQGNRFKLPGTSLYLSIGSSSGTKNLGLWGYYSNNGGVHYGVSNFVYLSELPCVLTDAAGNEYTGTLDGTASTLPSFPLLTFSNKAFNEDGTNFTATVTFPFPVSSEEQVNATFIANWGASGDPKKWCPVLEEGVYNVKVYNTANSSSIALSEVNKWRWAIYPQFADGTFTYLIKNVHTGTYVYADPTRGENAQSDKGRITLQEEGTAFTVVANGSNTNFAYVNNAGTTLKLTTNGGGDNNVYLGSYAGDHAGNHITFPTPKYTVTTDANGYAAIYTPMAVTIPSGVTACVGSLNDDNTMVSTRVLGNTIPANTAVILQGTTSTSYEFTAANDVAAIEDNDLRGAVTSVEVSAIEGSAYTFNASNETFIKVTEGTIPAYSAYIVAQSEAEVIATDAFKFEVRAHLAANASKLGEAFGKAYYVANGEKLYTADAVSAAIDAATTVEAVSAIKESFKYNIPAAGTAYYLKDNHGTYLDLHHLGSWSGTAGSENTLATMSATKQLLYITGNEEDGTWKIHTTAEGGNYLHQSSTIGWNSKVSSDGGNFKWEVEGVDVSGTPHYMLKNISGRNNGYLGADSHTAGNALYVDQNDAAKKLKMQLLPVKSITLSAVTTAEWLNEESVAVPSNEVPEKVDDKYNDKVVSSGEYFYINKGYLKGLFQYRSNSGNNRADIVAVEVIDLEGNVVAADYHWGYTGNNSQDNTYAMDIREDGLYYVRYYAEYLDNGGSHTCDVDITYTLLPANGYYYMSSRAVGRHEHLYNNALHTGNATKRLTLQSNTRVATNNGIWYISYNADGSMNIKNGDGNAIVPGDASANVIDSYTKLHMGQVAFDGTTPYYYFTEALNCSQSGYSLNGINILTTWTGDHADAHDNQWRLDPVSVEGKTIYEVVVNGDANAYVAYNDGTTTQNAFNGGFFIADEPITEAQLKAGFAGNVVESATITVEDNVITLANVVTFPTPVKQDLYNTSKGDGVIPPYRIPGITVDPETGRLITAAARLVCGTDPGYGQVDVVCRISDNHGETWGDMIDVAVGTGRTSATENYFDTAFGDPAIVADRTSNEVLIIAVAGCTVYADSKTTRQNPNMIATIHSTDNGNTWGEPVNVTEDIYSLFDSGNPIQSAFVGGGKIFQSRIVKKDQYYRLYAAMCARPNGNRVIYSDDFGRTWHALGGASALPAPGGDEPKCEELPDGRVILSSRVGGGRIYNIYTYSNTTTAEGSWGTSVKSTFESSGYDCSGGQATNGEMLIVPVKRNSDGKEMYLALQSLPTSGRSRVGIYYKELTELTDINSVANFAIDWNGFFLVTDKSSAYSSMDLQNDNRIGFIYEETRTSWEQRDNPVSTNFPNGEGQHNFDGYDNIYVAYPLEYITDGAYSIKRDVNRRTYLQTYFTDLIADAVDDVKTAVTEVLNNLSPEPTIGEVDNIYFTISKGSAVTAFDEHAGKAGFFTSEAVATYKTEIMAATQPEGLAEAKAKLLASKLNIVSGKAYTFKNVQMDGTTMRWYKYDGTNIVLTANEAEATPFVCRLLDNGKYVFVCNDGKYMTWRAVVYGCTTTGVNDAYHGEGNLLTDITIAKMTAGANINGDLSNTRYVSISAKRPDKDEMGYVVVKKNGGDPTFDGAGDAYYNDNFSSAFIMEEVEVPFGNAPKVNNVGEGELLSEDLYNKHMSTFSATYATVAPEGVTAYYATKEGDNVVLNAIAQGKAIPAYTGVILVSEEAGNAVMLSAAGETAADVAGNLLVGSAGADKNMNGIANAYILTGGAQGAGFYRCSGGTLAANKAYLDLSAQAGANAPSVRIRLAGEQGGTPTEVEMPIANGQQPTAVYDLQGRRVLNPTKGMYIVNGKKMVIK